ncbi:MAG: NUDIX domain-containing protein [Chloroflexi bacterium]|nr:NUDIX domain-containing protein [Chloroflexota bacterium]
MDSLERDGDYRAIPFAVCFIESEGAVLLLKGAPDKVRWANVFNGVGGRVERGESILDATRREIREETGLEIRALRLRGVLSVTGAEEGIVFVLTALSDSRQVMASQEGSLTWVPKAKVFDLELAGCLPAYWPRLLSPNGGLFFATCVFDGRHDLQVAFADQPLITSS